MPNFSSPASTQTDSDKFLNFFQEKNQDFLKENSEISKSEKVLNRTFQKTTFVKILGI
jgi:hypothetical protein